MNEQRRDGRGNGAKRRMLLNGITGSSRPERLLPLDLRLRAIADNIPTSSIAELWVFPPLPHRDIACEFVVLLCYDGSERRRIVTAHVDAQRPNPDVDEFEWVQRLREHGTAPQSWVTGMPDRLLQRLSEAGVPEVIEVGGHLEAWQEAIARFANGYGNGDENGGGNGLEHRSVTPEIVFSTIYEDGNGAAVPGSDPNGETDS